MGKISRQKLQTIYNALKQDGYTQTYDEFERGMVGDNYANRHAVYKYLKDGGSDVGATYDEFIQRISTPYKEAARPSQEPQNKQAVSKPLTAQQRADALSKSNDMLSNVQEGTARTLGNIGRMGMQLSKQGRERLAAGKLQAIVQGAQTGLAGLQTKPSAPANGKSKGGSLPDDSVTSGPQVYDTVTGEDGKSVTRWLMPDGSLTTDAMEAENAEYAARQGRIAHDFKQKMRSNGLNPDKQEDVTLQRMMDKEEQARKRIDERARKETQRAEAEWSKQFDNSFWGRFSKALAESMGGTANLPGDTQKQQYMQQDQGVRAASAAQQQLSNARATMNEAREVARGNDGWLSRIGRGAKAGFGMRQMMDNGRLDLLDANALLNASQAYQQGKATAADKDLMSAAVLANAVQGTFGDKTGGWYGAAQSAVESAPFMAQMALSPSGVVTGGSRQLSRELARFGIKRFGKTLATKALGVTGRLLSDAAGAGVTYAMWGGNSTAADVINRYTGSPVLDEHGNVVFEDRDPSKAHAIKDALVTGYGEYLSEMLGEYFAPVGAKVNKLLGSAGRKVSNKILGKGSTDAASNYIAQLGASGFAKGYKQFQKVTHFNGTVGEYAEEVLNNIYAATFTDDMDFSTGQKGVFNLETNLETAGSVALSCGVMQGFGLGGAAVARDRSRRALRAQSAVNEQLFGKDAWAKLKEMIDGGATEQLADVYREAVKSMPESGGKRAQMMRGLYNYAMARNMYNGANFAALKMRMTGALSDVNNWYDDGYNSRDEARADIVSKSDAYKRIAARILDCNPDDVDMRLGIADDGNVDAAFDALASMTNGLSDRDRLSLRQYILYSQKRKGLVDSVDDDINAKQDASDTLIDNVAQEDEQTGERTVQTGVTRDGKNVHIVSGNVVMTGEGDDAHVDDVHSDRVIIIRNDETGEVRQVGPNELETVSEPVPAEQVADAARDQIAEQEAGRVSAEIGEQPIVPQVGGTYTVKTSDGQLVDVTVTEVDQDGNLHLTQDGQTEFAVVDPDALQLYIQDAKDAKADADAETEVEQILDSEQQQQDDSSQTSPSSSQVGSVDEIIQGDYIGWTDSNGGKHEGFVQSIDDDGYVIDFGGDNGIEQISRDDLADLTDYATRDGEVVYSRNDDTSSVTNTTEDDATTQSDDVVVQQPDDNNLQSPEVVLGDGASTDGKVVTPANENNSDVHQGQEETALSRIPVDKQTGEQMFGKVDSATALDALYEMTEGDMDAAYSVVVAQQKQAAEAVNGAKKNKPKKKTVTLKGTPSQMIKTQRETDAEYNAAMEEYNANVQAAEANKAVWNNIMSEIEKRDYARMQQEEAEAKAREEEEKKVKAEQTTETTDIVTEQPKPKQKQERKQKKNEDNKENATKEEAKEPKEKKQKSEKTKPKTKVENKPKEVDQPKEQDSKHEEEKQPNIEEPKAKPKNEGQFGLVSDERMEELKRRLREKLGQLNVGIDPEMLSLGMELAAGHIDRGIKKFADFAKVMIDDLGDAVRPYIKAFYNGAHDMIEDGGHKELADEMTPYDEVRAFDITNFKTEDENENVTEDKQEPEADDDVSDNENSEIEDEPLSAKIDEASADVNTNPTEAQKEAGNYKKGHVQVGAFDITIEQPEGSIRRGTDADGKKWESKMHNTYGYFRGTEGVDGDHIDVFLSNDIDGWNGRKVYIVDQYNPDGTFDEHKVMLGFNDMDEAKSDYLANYEKGWEDGRRIDVTAVNLEDFEKWIDSSHRKTKPFSEYKIAEKNEQREFERLYNEKLNTYEKHKSEQEEGLKDLLTDLANVGINLGNNLADQTSKNINKDGFFICNGSTTVYHGTQKLDLEVKDLEPSHKRVDGDSADFNGQGVYFTPTDDNDYGNGPDQKMLSCRLKIGKPFYVVGSLGLDDEQSRLFSEILLKYGYDAVIAYSNVYNCIEGFPTEIVALHRKVIVPFSEYVSVSDKQTVTNGHGLETEQQTDKYGIPTDAKVIWSGEINGYGAEIGYDSNPRIEIFHDIQTGMNTVRVNVFDRNAETPARIRAILEKEGYDIDIDGESSGFVEFDNYDDAKKFSDHVDEVQKQVDKSRDIQGNPVNEDNSENKQENKLRNEIEKRLEIEIHKVANAPQLGKELTYSWEVSYNSGELTREQLLRLEKNANDMGGSFDWDMDVFYMPTEEAANQMKEIVINEAIGDNQENKAENDNTSVGDSFEERVKSIRVEDVENWDKSIDERCTESYKQKSGKKQDGMSIAVGVNKAGDVYIKKNGKGGYTLVIRDAKNYTVDEIRSRIDMGIDATVDDARAINDCILNLNSKFKNDYHVNLFKENGINRPLTGNRTISDLYNEFKKQSDNENETILDKANRIADEQKKKREEKSKEKTEEKNIKADEKNDESEEKKNEAEEEAEERVLRDAVIDKLRESGMDVITDEEEGQRVLDEANGNERLSAKKRRALETASLGKTQSSPRSLTVVSSADGAKVLKNIDILESEFEKSTTQPKTFIGEVAKALGAKRYGSASEYATFETKNGKIVTIRLSNHNAKVSNFDVNDEANGISIVVSPKKSEGVTNDGTAHVVEYYYDALKLRRADGKPLADIVRSIKQALYSGVFEDTTGLAERQEVNADDVVRYNKVYHGSASDFDRFDHSHMGEGEGAQAYGWGTYVTEVEGIGRTYAKQASYGRSLKISTLESHISRAEQRLPFERGEAKEEDLRDIAQWKQELEQLKNKTVEQHLYTVEIPDDTGTNYLDWDGKLSKSINKETLANKVEELLSNDRDDIEIEMLVRDLSDSIDEANTGEELYKAIAMYLGDKGASDLLHDMGFTGIKYPANFQRGGREDGKKNYVIFNEADAKITDHVRFFRTAEGEAYGFTIGGKIYIDPRIANSETPIHEYAHLWATALRKGNAKEWQNVVGLMKGTKVWDEVKKRYPEMKSDDEIADEVLATYSGRRGAERLREEMRNVANGNGSVMEKAAAVGAMERVKRALDKFWKSVADFLHIHYTSAEEVADRVMKDLLDGVNPRMFGVGNMALMNDKNESEEARPTFVIKPSTYTNKAGKTTKTFTLTVDGITREKEAEINRFASEKIERGRFAPKRGWRDKESGGWMFRSEEDARNAAEMVAGKDVFSDAERVANENKVVRSNIDTIAEIIAKDKIFRNSLLENKENGALNYAERVLTNYYATHFNELLSNAEPFLRQYDKDPAKMTERVFNIASSLVYSNIDTKGGVSNVSNKEQNKTNVEPKNNQDDGLLRNDDDVRTKGLRTENSEISEGGSRGSHNEEVRQEGGRTDGRTENGNERIGGEVQKGNGRPSGRVQGLTEPKNTRNNHSERGVDHAPKSVNARITANINAIELARELLESDETATPEQMSVLRKFSGWGGLGTVFSNAGYNNELYKLRGKLRSLLGPEEFEQAVMSANSAYYTPAYVIDTLWDIAEQLGFKGGNILEGSAGIGNILGQMPINISERSNIHAVEIDSTSGGILSLLYPDAKVDIQGFEKTSIPNGSVDLAITNVPFVTGLRVSDTTGDRDLSKRFHNIHDFCIAKNVRKLKEGGIGIFISSNGTLDNSKDLRDWVVNEGGSDFIGAFRLNNTTFEGAPVTSDIIVIRKRVDGKKSENIIDVSDIGVERSAKYLDQGKGKEKLLPMDYNKYFIEHPDHMAGEMRFGFEVNNTFRATSKGLYPVEGKDQGKLLEDFIKSFKKEQENADSVNKKKDGSSFVNDAEQKGRKVGELYLKDGKLVIAGAGGYYPLEVNSNKVKGHTKEECFAAYSAIKSALADVMQYQTNHDDDKGLKPLLNKLNKAYDDFVGTYGHFNKNNPLAWLKNDIDFPNVISLEIYKEQGDGKGGVVKTFDKADIMKGRVLEKKKESKPKDVRDGVVVSMFENGRIDIPYIAKKLGKDENDVKREIIESGLGFEDPISRKIEVSYLYLSGNVREKLHQAEENNSNGEYDRNIKALKKIIPMDIPTHLIDFKLGSSWIDSKFYDEYVKERTDIDVHFTHAGGIWVMDAPYYVVNEKNIAMGVKSEETNKTIFGTMLIEAAIKNKTITVSGTDYHGRVFVDKEATTLCSDKINEIREDFKDWMRNKMQNDSGLSSLMGKEYNELMNNYVPVEIPDIFTPKHFEGANPKYEMRPHQGKAIIRGTMQPLMIAHEVGTGKTFTLISTAMEMRRLGTARKPMIVVQNATVGQFVESAKELYPNAKILALEDADRSAEGRKRFYAKIKYNDWDMIIIPQSAFDFIPDSEERQIAFIKDKIEEKLRTLDELKEGKNDKKGFEISRAEREIDELNKELSKLEGESLSAKDLKKKEVTKQNAAVKAEEMLERKTDKVENFDDMEIDALLIDEAHEYKHLGFSTAMQRGVKGIDPSYSKKSQGLYLKTKAVLEKNHGKNIVFATGTPISNTAAELWTFMRYLMPKETMKEYGIYYFDDFVRNFGNIQQMLEFTANGFKENNRFSGYLNIPELVRIWSEVSDTALTKDQKELIEKIPDIEGGKATDIYLPQTRALRSVMKYVRDELRLFENMSGKEKKENSSIPLRMYGIAQSAAVDARLVVSNAEDDPNSKTNETVRQTLRSLKETNDYRGTVAIFADHYQNKRSGFNLYEDIKKKLVENGVHESEVVIIKSNMPIKKKLEIFDKVNHGEIRVILGSTSTLGTGVNIQERLHTLIHIDAPNRPMDYIQRNGRILRQGNLHKKWGKPVRLLRFGVEDSLDVTAYQRLKTKNAIIESIMNGKKLMQDSMNNRTLEEEDDVFGDTVAQLSGSEYAMLKNNAERNVRKYESRKKQWKADQIYIVNSIPRIESYISDYKKRIEDYRERLSVVQKTFPGGKFKEISIGKQKFSSIDAMSDFIKEYNKKILDAMKEMKENSSSSTHDYKLTMSVDGLNFTIDTKVERGIAKLGTLVSEVHRNMTYSCPELGLKDVPVDKSLIKNAIIDITDNVITGNDFKERLDSDESAIERYNSDLEQLNKRKDKPFEFEKELEESQRQYEEYSKAMVQEMAEKEKKYAEMDKNIAAADGIDELTDDDLYRVVDDAESGVLSKARVPLRERMRGRVSELAEKLHLDNVEVVADGSQLEGRRKKAKGFYNRKTGKITIVIGNHGSVADVERTLLHEAVAHYGLRELLGKGFGTFLDYVFLHAKGKARERISEAIRERGMDYRTATEEYLASMAETEDFESPWAMKWLHELKHAFVRLLNKLGFSLGPVTMSDNDMKYWLWRSYENLKKPEAERSMLDVANDIAMQSRMGVGEFADNSTKQEEEEKEKVENDLLFRQASYKTAREMYDGIERKFFTRLTEAWQDSMKAVKVLQDAVSKFSGKPIKDFEDAYSAENRMHGTMKNKAERFMQRMYKPLINSVRDLMQEGDYTQKDVNDYMVARHGLERNLWMAFDAALEENDMGIQPKKNVIQAVEQARKDVEAGTMSWTDYISKLEEEIKKEIDENLLSNHRKDYSGLTSIDGAKSNSLKDIEDHAKDVVSEIEGKYKKEALNLWNNVKACTAETFKEYFEGGMMSLGDYDYTRRMYESYIPLRGWDENRAADTYDYLSAESNSTYSPALIEAEGRTSMADSPIAYIGNIYTSTIGTAERNKVKQKLYNLARNHANDVLRVSEQWYYNLGTKDNPKWVAVSAENCAQFGIKDGQGNPLNEINEGDTPYSIPKKIQAFEDAMTSLEKSGMASKNVNRLDISPLNATDPQKREHTVRVTINGKKYTIYVCGSPAAAQAMNGSNIVRKEDPVSKMLGKMNRFFAGAYTSYNPEFVASNLCRDFLFSEYSVANKEDAKYVRTFQSIAAKVLSPSIMKRHGKGIGKIGKAFIVDGYMPKLVSKWEHGTLDTNVEMERLFKEFLTNGGETGFTSSRAVDEFKDMIRKELLKNGAKAETFGERVKKTVYTIDKVTGNTASTCAEVVEFYNRAAEDASRFIVYATSRKMGRSVARSINDAKNITLNFNRKGSGAMGNVAFREWVLFLNPTIQAMDTLYSQAKEHPVKFSTTTALLTGLGILVPVLNGLAISLLGGGGDDKPDYYDLTESERRNNICLWIGGNNWLKIPLDQGMRAIYGAGELSYSIATGKYTGNIPYAVTEQVTNLLPYDLASYGEEWSWTKASAIFAPQSMKTAFELAVNKDWTGRDISYESKFTGEYAPEWTKANNRTPDWITEVSKYLNEKTGGNEFKKGTVDINPSKVQHILGNTFGGSYNMLSKTAGVIYDISHGIDIKTSKTPFVSRFISSPKERNGYGSLHNEFMNLKNEYEAFKYELNGLKKKGKSDSSARDEYRDKSSSDEARFMNSVGVYIKQADKYRKKANEETDDEDKRYYMEKQREAEKQAVDMMNE